MEYTLFTYASRAHSRVKLLAISDIHQFRLKPDTSNSHEFELHRPSNKGTKLLLKVIKAIIIIINVVCAHKYDGYVQHKCLTYTILHCLNAALFLASNPPTSSNPDLHALPSLKETNKNIELEPIESL